MCVCFHLAVSCRMGELYDVDVLTQVSGALLCAGFSCFSKKSHVCNGVVVCVFVGFLTSHQQNMAITDRKTIWM